MLIITACLQNILNSIRIINKTRVNSSVYHSSLGEVSTTEIVILGSSTLEARRELGSGYPLPLPPKDWYRAGTPREIVKLESSSRCANTWVGEEGVCGVIGIDHLIK